MKERRFITRKDGERIEIEMVGDGDGLFGGKHCIACCDCGLVHDLEFISNGSELGFIATRNESATANRRSRDKARRMRQLLNTRKRYKEG